MSQQSFPALRPRRNIEDLARNYGFVGIDKIHAVYNQIPVKARDIRMAYAGLWLTGCRIGELTRTTWRHVRPLKQDPLAWRFEEVVANPENIIYMVDVPLEKRWTRVEDKREILTKEELPKDIDELRKIQVLADGRFLKVHYKVKHDIYARRGIFGFKVNDLFAVEWLKWVDMMRRANMGPGWLYPAKTDYEKTMSEAGIFYHFRKLVLPETSLSAVPSFSYGRELAEEKEKGNWIFPHWLRSQRASYFGEVMGWRIEDIKQWFSWANVNTATIYTAKSPEALANMTARRETVNQTIQR